MGLFSRSKDKKAKEPKKQFPWIPLTEMSQLDEIKEKSKSKPQVIFKHSTRCGISSMVIKQFEATYSLEDQVDIYYLDLLNFRPISLKIAEKFSVMHQSPQLIALKNGEVVGHSSHHDISAASLEKISIKFLYFF
ncbi:bacillithiol system redox-active protein YtxJ [Aquimarina agarivorans]|uniref:bacillithiol system redox-active protein YtxJ n=1 Tax=Aquimarina agarivorans TaxID=980584 RepID=UPI000248EC6B|nr:bacillithiol system redox-active protein YtxJ [Aquimarina agarivorans]